MDMSVLFTRSQHRHTSMPTLTQHFYLTFDTRAFATDSLLCLLPTKDDASEVKFRASLVHPDCAAIPPLFSRQTSGPSLA